MSTAPMLTSAVQARLMRQAMVRACHLLDRFGLTKGRRAIEARHSSTARSVVHGSIRHSKGLDAGTHVPLGTLWTQKPGHGVGSVTGVGMAPGVAVGFVGSGGGAAATRHFSHTCSPAAGWNTPQLPLARSTWQLHALGGAATTLIKRAGTGRFVPASVSPATVAGASWLVGPAALRGFSTGAGHSKANLQGSHASTGAASGSSGNGKGGDKSAQSGGDDDSKKDDGDGGTSIADAIVDPFGMAELVVKGIGEGLSTIADLAVAAPPSHGGAQSRPTPHAPTFEDPLVERHDPHAVPVDAHTDNSSLGSLYSPSTLLDSASSAFVGGVDALAGGVKYTGEFAQGAITGVGAVAKLTTELAGNTAKAALPQLGKLPVPGVVKGGVSLAGSAVGAAKTVVDSGVGAVTGVGGVAGRAAGAAVRGTVNTVGGMVGGPPQPVAGERGAMDAVADLMSTTAGVAVDTVDVAVSTVDDIVTGGREAVVDVLQHTVGDEAAAVADDSMSMYHTAVKTVASVKGATPAKLMKKAAKEAVQQGVKATVAPDSDGGDLATRGGSKQGSQVVVRD